MKEKTKNEELIDRELEKLVPGLSETREIDVDLAWMRVNSTMTDSAPAQTEAGMRRLFIRSNFLKIAAAVLVLIGLGTAALFISNNDWRGKSITASTGDDDSIRKVRLPDGSLITLNRNSQLSYFSDFGKKSRDVSLKGEAFFEIAADASKPFTIDAGNALVRVVGTSFNVITKNINNEVEVFVETGKVVLSDNNNDRNIVLEPGYIGIMNSEHAEKNFNQDPNYMSWNTGRLEYDGQSLDVVFRDLKRVYNMDIVADDESILSNTWTSPIDIQSRDTIIRLICTSFNLSYIKDGNVYYLSKK